MEIIRATADTITINLGPDDALAVNNALNEICNGVHLDEWDFQTRMGVDREHARKVLHAIGARPAPPAAICGVPAGTPRAGSVQTGCWSTS